jgi:hypothetical protein
MNPLDFLDEFERNLRAATHWHTSKELLAEVETGNTLDRPSDFIYEMYCLFRIVNDLAENQIVRLIKGIKHGFRFPRKPANKFGWPRFDVVDKITGKTLTQICAGTKIWSNGAQAFRAPDISLQLPYTSDDPKTTDLICIYDAKFNEGRKKDTLSEGEYAKVSMMVGTLGLRRIPVQLPVVFETLKNFDANCVLTNGGPWSMNHDFHRDQALRVVYDFHESKMQYAVIGV